MNPAVWVNRWRSVICPLAGRRLGSPYTAEPIEAEQALALGIINRVVADDELAGATSTLARKLAQGPRIALALMKQHLNAAESSTLAALLDLEATHQIETGRTQDHKEAARAFVEKRPPVFVGR